MGYYTTYPSLFSLGHVARVELWRSVSQVKFVLADGHGGNGSPLHYETLASDHHKTLADITELITTIFTKWGERSADYRADVSKNVLCVANSRWSVVVGTASESESNFKNANTGTTNSPTVLPPTSTTAWCICPCRTAAHDYRSLTHSHGGKGDLFHWDLPFSHTVNTGTLSAPLQRGGGRREGDVREDLVGKGKHCSSIVITSQGLE